MEYDLARQRQVEQGAFSPYVQGTFISAESEDPGLSQVRVLGTVLRYVSKLKHVTLTAGDSILMVKGNGMSLTIIGVIVGDPSKAA